MVRIFGDFPTFFSDFATPLMISLHFLVIPLRVSVISLLFDDFPTLGQFSFGDFSTFVF